MYGSSLMAGQIQMTAEHSQSEKSWEELKEVNIYTCTVDSYLPVRSPMRSNRTTDMTFMSKWQVHLSMYTTAPFQTSCDDTSYTSLKSHCVTVRKIFLVFFTLKYTFWAILQIHV